MARHVVVGRGPIGRTLAHQLVAEGHDVLVLSRSGAAAPTPVLAPVPEAVEPGTLSWAAVDGTDAVALTRAARGAEALYNCANPTYYRWPTDWPPIAEALLTAAAASGAVLVTAANLYVYPPGTRPMREDSPVAPADAKGEVRAEMWAQARRRHDAGDVRATEVRGSDYLGPDAADNAHAGSRMLRPLLAGGTIRPIGSADALHSWTYLPDFARALRSAAGEPQAWGRAWHVPSPEPSTLRDVARRFAAAAGAPEPRISPLPMSAVRALGLVVPLMREIGRIGYQFTEPFVLDSTASQRVLGLTPTSWPQIVEETLAAWTDGAVSRG